MCSNLYVSKKVDSTEDSNNGESTSSSVQDEKFSFPPAPRLCKSASPCSFSCKSDSSVSDGKLVRNRRRNRRKSVRTLPPIGVFWDIENCQVPRTKNATSVVQRIRELFYADYREAEFLVVCDVKKESAQIIQDLNDAQVNLIHVSSTSKNAADEKLRQSVRRFAELHKAPAAVALISSDVNFAADLSDLRYRKKIHVILIHNSNVADALILCANETYNFMNITENLPSIKQKTAGTQAHDLLIYNLPVSVDNVKVVKGRLKLLSDNCGGKVTSVAKEHGTAILRFNTLDMAKRAQKRLEGEDVFGNKIRVSNPGLSRESPFKNYTGRKTRNQDVLYQVPPVPMPPGYGQSAARNTFYPNNLSGNWQLDMSQFQGFPNAQPLPQSVFRPIRGSGVLETPSNTSRSNNRSFGETNEPKANQPVELIVSNLDSSISMKELQNVLLTMIKQYAMVLSLTMNMQADGAPAATVKVASQQEAQFVISQLHHQWLGCKRMTISYSHTNSDPDQLRLMIISILREVPGHKMPLFKFFELIESRYHCSVSLSEVNKLRDVSKITEGHGGRSIMLTAEASAAPIYTGGSLALYCTVHCPNGLESRGWGESEEVILPNVKIPLKEFSVKANQLVVSHMGCVPLLSFPICYTIEFGAPLPVDEAGVPLEHLVTCVSNIELSCNGQNKNIKFLKLKDLDEKPKEVEDLTKSVSPSLVTNINMLCREVVDLLKTAPHCQLLMSRYIPAYHHHFGRQCRVADYGFTRLVDLFEAISHVVQIIGSGPKRIITLTHSTQMRRFTSDLLRVVKSQVSAQVSFADFPAAYEKALKKPFDPVEYGLCTLDDLLDEVPESTVVISRGGGTVISIPKKEQTPEQVQRTKQFAVEVVELLSHSANCSMLFNKFVPAYHHHFGKQCKVSDYGFSKLVELFEAIPSTVEVILEGASDVDRRVKLKPEVALKVLGSQIQNLIKESRPSVLLLEVLAGIYRRSFGFTLKPEAYGCVDYTDLITKLSDFVQVVNGAAGPMLVLVDVEIQTLEIRIWSLLLNPPHSSTIKNFIHDYRVKFHSTLSMTKLENMKSIVTICNNGTEAIVSLTDYYILAAQIYHLVFANGGHISLSNLEAVYSRKFGHHLNPRDYGAETLDELLREMRFLLILRGKKMNIALNKQLGDCGVQLPPSISRDTEAEKKDFPWPPPAAHSLMGNLRGITPPKPDTPPADNGWNVFWSSSPKHDNMNLAITLPPVDTSKMLMDTEGLLSPTRSLLSAHTHPLNVIPKITAPHPNVLPLPDKLMPKDDFSDSGVNSSKVEYTLSDNEFFSEAVLPLGTVSQPGSYNLKTFSTLNM